MTSYQVRIWDVGGWWLWTCDCGIPGGDCRSPMLRTEAEARGDWEQHAAESPWHNRTSQTANPGPGAGGGEQNRGEARPGGR